ncbi:MAG: CvpA family protein, partial [Desulfobacteraceae bacterium]|nr:CvpA family protein [Desulfobacteraceae bacterium]
WIENPVYRDLLCFSVLFCVILIMIALISILLRKFLKLVFLGWVDRTCGLIFGAAKGVLLVSVIFIILTTLIPKGSTFLEKSVFAPQVAQVSRILTVFVSKNLRHDFLKELEGVKKIWKQ